MAYIKNTAQDLYFPLVSKTTGAAVTGATPTGYRTIEGTQASVSGSISEVGNGQYRLSGAAADFNGDEIGFLFVEATSVLVSIVIPTVTKSISDLNDFDPAATKVDVGKVNGNSVTSTNDFKADVTGFVTEDYLDEALGSLDFATACIDEDGLSLALENLDLFDPATDTVDIGAVNGTPTTSIDDFKADVSSLTTEDYLDNALSTLDVPAPEGCIDEDGLSLALSNLDLFDPTTDKVDIGAVNGVAVTSIDDFKGTGGTTYAISSTTVGEAPTVNVVAYKGEALEFSVVCESAQTDNAIVFHVFNPATKQTIFMLTSADGDITIGGSGDKTVTIASDDSNTGVAGTYAYLLWDMTGDEVLCQGSLVIRSTPDYPTA